MKKITILFSVLLAFNSVESQTIFDFDTNASGSGSPQIVTEMIDGITTTVSAGAGSILLEDWGGWGGSTANIIANYNGSPVTVTFDQPVVVNSILPIDGDGGNVDYTFTPTGGNNNSTVVVSLVGGFAPDSASIDLNWIGVTSFTVTASTSATIVLDNLSVYGINNPTIFDFDTNASGSGSPQIVTEMIGGITTTVSAGAGSILLEDWGGWGGSTANIIANYNGSPVTVTFDQPVVVNSILPIDGDGGNVDYTFTPTGGNNNSTVVVSLVGGFAPDSASIDLNWIGVTSFTVTASTSATIVLDNLSVSAFESLTVADNYKVQKAKVYPNPVGSILTIKNVSDLKFIDVYNNLGQRVLQTKQNVIDMSHLSKGMYFLQIHTNCAMETKRVIKR